MITWPPLLALLIAIPMTSAVLTPAVARGNGKRAFWWALGVMSVASVIAMMLIARVSQEGPFSYVIGGWVAPYGIELRFDEFSAVIAIVCLLGLLDRKSTRLNSSH